jgi:hypothetical protein
MSLPLLVASFVAADIVLNVALLWVRLRSRAGERRETARRAGQQAPAPLPARA